MDDVCNTIKYKSAIRFIFKVCRVWFMSATKYGVKLKVLKIQVKMIEAPVNEEKLDFIESETE